MFKFVLLGVLVVGGMVKTCCLPCLPKLGGIEPLALLMGSLEQLCWAAF